MKCSLEVSYFLVTRPRQLVRLSAEKILLFMTNSLHSGGEFFRNIYIFPADGMTIDQEPYITRMYLSLPHSTWEIEKCN